MSDGIYRYTVYQIENILTGKIYVGAHGTSDLNDRYMGSSKTLKEDIKCYGRRHFIKTILFVFDTADEMMAKEREIVTKEFVARDDTYNIMIGGYGSLPDVLAMCYGRKGQKHPMFGRKHSEESRRKMSESSKGVPKPWLRGRKVSDDTRRKQSAVRRGRPGLPLSDETKQKLSKDRRGEKHWFYGKERPEQSARMRGENNPFYGKTHSEASIAKQRDSLRAYYQTKYQYEILTPTNDVHTTHSLGEYCREHHLSRKGMFDCLHGRREHHKGYLVRRLPVVGKTDPAVEPVDADA